VGLPVVNADKCNGCGQCEDKCPVLGEAAIIVVPQGELRLTEGSYVEEATSLGLVFEAKKGVQDQFRLDDDALPGQRPDGPGKPHGGSDLPPGIEPEEETAKPELPPGIDPED
jgi:ferredoxin